MGWELLTTSGREISRGTENVVFSSVSSRIGEDDQRVWEQQTKELKSKEVCREKGKPGERKTRGTKWQKSLCRLRKGRERNRTAMSGRGR